jgi:hypothetical protein
VDEELEDVEEDEAESGSRATLRAALVKDVKGRLIVPELRTIRKYLPMCYDKIKAAGQAVCSVC